MFVGLALLMLTLEQTNSIPELMSSLPKGKLLLFVITNVLSPLAMVAGGVGLWQRKLWGWWLSVIAIGAGLSSIFIMLLKIPTGAAVFISSNAIGSIIGIFMLWYLAKPGLMAAFGFGIDERKKTLGIAFAISVLVGVLVVILTPDPKNAANFQESSNQSFNKDAP